MRNRKYLKNLHIGAIVKGTALAGVLTASTLMVGCKDDSETADAEVVAEVNVSTEKENTSTEKDGEASATTATAENGSTEAGSVNENNSNTSTEATRTTTGQSGGTNSGKQVTATEATSKATATTASSRGNNSTTETSRANATTEAPKPSNSTTETSKPNSTTESPKPSNSTTEAPATTEHTHSWVENTEAVYIPESGHYEEIMVDPGGEVPHYVTHTLCAHCGYDYSIDPDNCGLDHICPDGTTNSNYGDRVVQDGYITIPPYYEKRWIVDTPAHTEQQGNGTYKCSTCGAEK